ncbi:MAG: amidohydrolase, partial [Armatimonadetes bacterium]|nr:amidohydrolase [Armatimonadota bacterium]
MIYRAKYLLPINGGVIENGEALVSGELISAVGVGLTDKYPHEPVRDLGCCALMPGFVNAH